MALHEVLLAPPTLDALARELAGLAKRRAFVVGAGGAALRDTVTLVVVHPASAARLALPAEVVWVQAEGPGAGLGLELAAVDPDALDRFARGEPDEEPLPELDPERDAAPPEEELMELDPERDAAPEADGEADLLVEAGDDGAANDGGDAETGMGAEEAGGLRRAPSLYDRIRAMSLRERDHTARAGQLSERVALERAYGSTVWESLLSNPQLTPPEVARIAKNGKLPQPLVAVICANAAWLGVGEVRRALLSNPRVTGPQLDRVLRGLSTPDLRRLAQGAGQPPRVRRAAQRLLAKL